MPNKFTFLGGEDAFPPGSGVTIAANDNVIVSADSGEAYCLYIDEIDAVAERYGVYVARYDPERDNWTELGCNSRVGSPIVELVGQRDMQIEYDHVEKAVYLAWYVENGGAGTLDSYIARWSTTGLGWMQRALGSFAVDNLDFHNIGFDVDNGVAVVSVMGYFNGGGFWYHEAILYKHVWLTAGTTTFTPVMPNDFLMYGGVDKLYGTNLFYVSYYDYDFDEWHLFALDVSTDALTHPVNAAPSGIVLFGGENTYLTRAVSANCILQSLMNDAEFITLKWDGAAVSTILVNADMPAALAAATWKVAQSSKLTDHYYYLAMRDQNDFATGWFGEYDIVADTWAWDNINPDGDTNRKVSPITYDPGWNRLYLGWFNPTTQRGSVVYYAPTIGGVILYVDFVGEGTKEGLY